MDFDTTWPGIRLHYRSGEKGKKKEMKQQKSVSKAQPGPRLG